MYQVYFQYGYHSIREFTDEEFEKLKKSRKMFEWEDGFYISKNQRVYAWKVEE